MALSIGTVFAFAGPHNWIELRYFVSRLPSRFGPFRNFFASSFSGVVLLGIAYAGLIAANRAHALDYSGSIFLFQSWIFAFFSWLVCLVVFRQGKSRVAKFLIPFILLAASCSLAQPLAFGLSLVYLHPLIGLFILDRELSRSRKSWLKPYRIALCTVPLFLLLLVNQLTQAEALSQASLLDQQIVRHAGSSILKSVSTHLLVSVHVFLEMIHYAVWLIAIPLATSAWTKWRFEQVLTKRHPAAISKMIPAVFAGSSLLVMGLWLGFSSDYSATRDLYFTVAIFHVLAELPFLLWML